MPLDFTRATDLFVSTEQELALALDISVADLRSYRQKPDGVPPDVVDRLAGVLIERGRGMVRVGELLRD